jgi:hypothetical protein
MPQLPIEVMRKRTAALMKKQRALNAEKRGSKSNPLNAPSKASLLSLSSSASNEFEFELESTPEPETEPLPEPLELVYNIRRDDFRQAPHSTVLKQNTSRTPLIDLPVTGPPLLVDGRMQIVQIPKWKREVGFYWRSCNGATTEVRWKSVRLPWKIWMERNFGEEEKWTELWIERA